MHMHMLAARWVHHHTDPSGADRSIAVSPWLYIQWFETKNRGHIGGSRGWNSTLECVVWTSSERLRSARPLGLCIMHDPLVIIYGMNQYL